MDENQFSELKAMVGNLQERMEKIEHQLYHSQTRPVQEKPIKPLREPKIEKASSEEEFKSSNILGIVGVGCLIVAMILLIKFSIDSGWLNPPRQILLATVFGGSLICLPLLWPPKDKAYISLLPAAGVVTLHLTIYGAIFYHGLIAPSHGIWLVSGIGLLSLWLLTKFNEWLYALLAIAGTYVGSFILKDTFEGLSQVALHMIVWDIIFAAFAIYLKNRTLISITAYFALGLVAFFGFSLDTSATSQVIQYAVTQFFQILIFACATAAYSIKNKSTLTEDETWQLFPIFLFFYGQEYYYLDLINPFSATIFSLGFALVIFALYWQAKTRLGKDHLESGSAVMTLTALMVYHSLYFVTFGFMEKMIAGLILMAILGMFQLKLQQRAFKGFNVLTLFVIGWSMFLLLFNTENVTDKYLVIFGILYGAVCLYGYKLSSLGLLTSLANIMIVTAICRLKDVVGEIWIGPMIVAFAFSCLVMSLKTKDKVLAQASFPVIFFAIARFVFFNFSNLSQGERIISLLVMGALIYASGYFYRQIPEAKNLKKEINR